MTCLRIFDLRKRRQNLVTWLESKVEALCEYFMSETCGRKDVQSTNYTLMKAAITATCSIFPYILLHAFIIFFNISSFK